MWRMNDENIIPSLDNLYLLPRKKHLCEEEMGANGMFSGYLGDVVHVILEKLM
jgi:hypothetical protein